MYKIIFAAVLLSAVSMNAQTVAEKAVSSNPLENQIQSSKSKIDLEKERIVKANTTLLTDARNRMSAAQDKFKAATETFAKEKAAHKTAIAKEKANIKQLTAEIKKYK